MLRAVPRLLLALVAGILLIAVFLARSTVEPTPPARVAPVDDLGTTRDVPLFVCDADGRPVEGAVARADEGESSITSAPTDAEGRTVLRSVPDTTCELSIGALRYATARVAVPDVPVGPSIVQLERASCLEVLLRTPEEQPATDLYVHIRSTGPPFLAPDRARPDPLQVELGATPGGRLSVQYETGKYEVRFAGGEEGRVLLCGLSPSHRFSLSVLDRHGHVAAKLPSLRIASKEWRELVVPVEGPPRAVAGVVRDSEGAPLAGASVWVVGAQDLAPRTGPDGAFRIEGLYARSVELGASAKGRALRPLDPVSLEAGDARVDVVLDRTRDVVASVVDRTGVPVAGGLVVAREIGSEDPHATLGFSRRVGERYGVRGLPPREVELVFELLGRTVTQVHDARLREALLEIETPASLRVTWDRPPGPGYTYWLELEGLRPPGVLTSVNLDHEAAEGSLYLPAVLPGSYRVRIQSLEWATHETEEQTDLVQVSSGEEALVHLDF